jgi:CheY-like chemotaxis protein
MDIPLPVYQHPTTTVLIDDSQTFLDSLAFQLGPAVPCQRFQEPRAAFEWLHRTLRQGWSGGAAIRVDYDEQTLSGERRTIALDLDRIYRQALDRGRFLTPAVLVIDYAMPQMDGLTFCRLVQDLPCRKILLTGQADEKIAIDAFNRGLIDRFIRKGDSAALDRLDADIRALQRRFFAERSATLKDLLERHTHAFLSDPAIAALAGQLTARYGFVEHYLFPNPPGILFFDKFGKGTVMVIETEAGLIAQYEAACDNDAPEPLREGLRRLALVPFFHDSGGMYAAAAAHDWLSYCLPAEVCGGLQDYYWACFDLPRRYLPGGIHPFADFLKQRP